MLSQGADELEAIAFETRESSGPEAHHADSDLHGLLSQDFRSDRGTQQPWHTPSRLKRAPFGVAATNPTGGFMVTSLPSVAGRALDRVTKPLIARKGLRNARATSLDHIESSPLFGYDEEPEARRDALMVRSHTMGSYERLISLWQQVRYVDRAGIPGALVECGVWKGGAAGMMALAHLRAEPTQARDLHLFDSFEGLPEPDRAVDGRLATEYSDKQDSGALRPIGECVGPLQANRELLERRVNYPVDRINYHVGWFEDTVARDAPDVGAIAVLRLDGDWYSSTRVCLENLYPLVSPGGVVVIDDYGHWEGCRKAVDEYLLGIGEHPLLGHIDYTARYFVKPKP